MTDKCTNQYDLSVHEIDQCDLIDKHDLWVHGIDQYSTLFRFFFGISMYALPLIVWTDGALGLPTRTKFISFGVEMPPFAFSGWYSCFEYFCLFYSIRSFYCFWCLYLIEVVDDDRNWKREQYNPSNAAETSENFSRCGAGIDVTCEIFSSY